jgi:hypothetical protein
LETGKLQYPKSITSAKDHCVPNSEGSVNYNFIVRKPFYLVTDNNSAIT